MPQSTHNYIAIEGAREHNLKNISVYIPKNKLVVITGLSGSGKSSLAFDTIYAEGQRRYMESFSAYARQFMGELRRPDVDSLRGLSPVVAIEQKTVGRNPRSTVGTITEIYDFLRLLFARIGVAYSYKTNKKMVSFTEQEMVSDIFKRWQGEQITLLAPLVRARKGHYRELFEHWRVRGFLKVRVDGTLRELEENMRVDRYKIHNIELVIDTLRVDTQERERLQQSVAEAVSKSGDMLMLMDSAGAEYVYSQALICADTGISYEQPSPNTFSFNSPVGYCPDCKGLGTRYEADTARIIPNEKLSLKEGAIVPIGKEREASTYQLMARVARAHKIPLNKPAMQIDKKLLAIILDGTEDYKGVIPLIEESFFPDTHDENPLRAWAAEFMQEVPCATCAGARLKKESLYFRIDEKNIAQIAELALDRLAEWVDRVDKNLSARERKIVGELIKEIKDRLRFLLDVGLGYLSLSLPARALSGGEAQRIRLTTQIGAELRGITYILDEPSIGLHQRDNHRLIHALQRLRDLGNSVIVVEHDRDIMLASDYIIDMGEGAGVGGGKIIAEGAPKEFLKNARGSTADYLRTESVIKKDARAGSGHHLKIYGARGHNLKNIDVSFPLGTLIVVTGVSGSGKSSLVSDTLYPALLQHCQGIKRTALPYNKLEGLEYIDKVIEIDQSPIGRIPRSNPATYCEFFTDIRTLFAAQRSAKERAYSIGRFSFNVKGGRCEVCQGAGIRKIDMGFLPSVHVPCVSCQGKRYNRETLAVRYRGKNISEVLEMSVDEAVAFFSENYHLHRKIKMLQDVGLGYISLGQSAVSLSGGEAQRVKLSTELIRKDTKKTFYILDEPTTGLHFKDIEMLMSVLDKLVDKGNTVLIVEHNTDVIRRADYVIDMGAEGGEAGGQIVTTGTPQQLQKMRHKSITAQYI